MRRLHDYDTMLAAHGLLGDAVSIVRTTNLPFCVIGGWAPFLLNRGSIVHPGIEMYWADAADDEKWQRIRSTLDHVLRDSDVPKPTEGTG